MTALLITAAAVGIGGLLFLDFLVGYLIGVRKGRAYERMHRQGKRKRPEIGAGSPPLPPMDPVRLEEPPENQPARDQPVREQQPQVWSDPGKTSRQKPAAAGNKPENVPLTRAVPREDYGQRVSIQCQTSAEALYGGFAAQAALKLDFNYAFPDTILLRQGEGYLVDRAGNLLPDRRVFSSVNMVTSYAMNGMLRIFDASVDGKIYTFQDIMDGALGTRYVQVAGVEAMALVQEKAGIGCYTLLKKGCLKLTFM